MQKGSLDVRQGGGHHRIVSDANYPQASAVESILAKRHTAGRCRTLWECCGGLLTHPSGRGYIMRGFQEGEMPGLSPNALALNYKCTQQSLKKFHNCQGLCPMGPQTLRSGGGLGLEVAENLLVSETHSPF